MPEALQLPQLSSGPKSPPPTSRGWCPQESCTLLWGGCSTHEATRPRRSSAQHLPYRQVRWLLQDGSSRVAQGWLRNAQCKTLRWLRAPTQNSGLPELSVGLRYLSAGICVWVRERFYLSWVLIQRANILCLKQSLCMQIPARPTRRRKKKKIQTQTQSLPPAFIILISEAVP